MDRKILIIDDNKMLTKLLAKKIQATLAIGVDIAFDMAEGKQLLKENEYFAAFVDLCLPDAPQGEIVDYVLSKKLPTIVLTGSNDTKTRKDFMGKDIIDYIYKESDLCISRILDAITRLFKNEKTKVILAMAKAPTRAAIKTNLTNELFTVMAAAHGEEALNYLSENPDTKLIICDANMPVVDGEGLLDEVRSKYTKSQLGVIIAGEKDDELEARLFSKGVSDYLISPVEKEALNCRINNCIDHMYSLSLIEDYSVHIDLLTGLKDEDGFYANAYEYFSYLKAKEEFAIGVIDIDKLEDINEDYGYENGDKVIKAAARGIKNEIKGSDIAARMNDNRFVVILRNVTNKEAVKIFSCIRVGIKQSPVVVSLDELYYTVSIGITFSNVDNTDINALVEEASQALTAAKDNGRDRLELCI